MADGYRALPRPNTLFNVGLRWLGGLLKAHPITEQDLKEWQATSLVAFLNLADDHVAVRKCLNPRSTAWLISPDPPPPPVLALDVQFRDSDTPFATLYQGSASIRIPLKTLRDAYAISGIDHALGHLWLFHAGRDYGEEGACYWQWRAARSRPGWQWRLISAAMPIGYRLHKQIPSSVFR